MGAPTASGWRNANGAVVDVDGLGQRGALSDSAARARIIFVDPEACLLIRG